MLSLSCGRHTPKNENLLILSNLLLDMFLLQGSLDHNHNTEEIVGDAETCMEACEKMAEEELLPNIIR